MYSYVRFNTVDFGLKGQCPKTFCFRFFHESSSPKPLKITLGSFQFFGKFAEIFASQGAPHAGINDTVGKFSLRYRCCCWYRWQIMGTISYYLQLKGTQDWEFFWLRFWNLRYFFLRYVKILRFYKKIFWLGHYWGRYDFSA